MDAPPPSASRSVQGTPTPHPLHTSRGRAPPPPFILPPLQPAWPAPPVQGQSRASPPWAVHGPLAQTSPSALIPSHSLPLPTGPRLRSRRERAQLPGCLRYGENRWSEGRGQSLTTRVFQVWWESPGWGELWGELKYRACRALLCPRPPPLLARAARPPRRLCWDFSAFSLLPPLSPPSPSSNPPRDLRRLLPSAHLH